ncbi:glycosyltransferase family 2 protein [Flavobacterium aestuarii]|uniref:glycosyltransferase family 2 protein n=1 Tax=Flavobacterium aestuarii TaxID=3149227 RepID=UPI0032B3976F
MVQDLLVTVFVPVYNGEKYLRNTLASIQNQTYKNIEVLLVDDSSTDGSKIILDEFASKDDRFKIFVKRKGGMVSVSWNFIKSEIKGDYVFYSSQDDVFSIDLLEKMVEKQKETNADSILPDMEFYFENTSNNKKIIGLNGNRELVLSGRKACEASLNWSIHGFPLTKTSLLDDEVFPEDAFDSDEFITRKLFLKSNKVVFSDGIFYYRQDNPNAITKTFSAKNFYTLNTLFRIFSLLKENNFEKSFVLNSQFSLLSKYLQLSAKFHLYDFETEIEKENTALFLSDFKKQHLINSFYFLNFSYAIMSLKLKYILLLIIFNVPFLFDFVIKVYMIKKKNQI